MTITVTITINSYKPYYDYYQRRENMVGVNMVGVNMAFHGAICECFAGAVLEPCLLKPCLDTLQRGVQWIGGAVDWGCIIQ